MTPEELDEARAKEAQRLWESGQEAGSSSWVVAARLAREGWTPPEPEPVVDPDILAFREFASKEAINWNNTSLAKAYLDGDMDSGASARLFLAGARMAREQERERARLLVEYVDGHAYRPDGVARQVMKSEILAREALAKYRGEA